MIKIKNACLILLLFSSSSTFAFNVSNYFNADTLKNVEFSAAAGPNWTYADNTHLTISPFEDDALKVSSVSNSILWKLGVGYHLFADTLREQDYEYLKDLLVEINLYRSQETIYGHVWQYQLPEFNNYSFRAPITSTRLMLDIKPTVYIWKRLSFYPILGAGVGWNNIAYHETVTGAGVDPKSNISLSTLTNTNFTYNLGLGVRTAITQHLNVSLEYLYTDLDSMYPSSSAATAARFSSQPVFQVRSQSILLGLSWKI